MNPIPRPPSPPKSPFNESQDGLGKVGGFVAAFFLAPIFFQVSIGWVRDFTLDRYGESWVNIVSLAWAIFCGLGVYWIAFALITDFLLKRRTGNLFRW